MKRIRTLFASAALVALMTACADETPVSPDGTADLGPAASVASAQDANWEYTGRHVVVFDEAIPVDFETRLGALGGSVVRSHPEISVAIVSGLDDAGAASLAADADIAAVPADVRVEALPDPAALGGLQTQSTPAGAPQPAGHDQTLAFFYPAQWNMHIIDADDAWNAGFNDASGVRVAILDTGIDPFHQDLAGLIDAASSIAFTPSTAPIGPAWGDDFFHGTHVAGTVASNGIGTASVAPHATLIAVKVCNAAGGCAYADVMSGLIWSAAAGADVANMSLGGFVNIPVPGAGPLIAALNRAVNFANANGVLVVSSAGNSAVDLDHIERDFRVTAFRATPCENGAGVCVSATGATDALAGYSNYGSSAINVAAPGGDFDGADLFGTTVLAPCSSLGVCFGSTNTYIFAQGTSMAAPHVSGAAALLDAQAGGAYGPGQLKSSLQRTADDLGKRGSDPFYGRGRINVCSLLRC